MRVGLMSAARSNSTFFYEITKMAVTLLNVPKKKQSSVLEFLLVFGAWPHALFLDERCGLARHKGRLE